MQLLLNSAQRSTLRMDELMLTFCRCDAMAGRSSIKTPRSMSKAFRGGIDSDWHEPGGMVDQEVFGNDFDQGFNRHAGLLSMVIWRPVQIWIVANGLLLPGKQPSPTVESVT